MVVDNSINSSSIEQRTCCLCGSNKDTVSGVVQCVTETAWQAWWGTLGIGNGVTTYPRFYETSDPINWNIVLCHECQAKQYIDVNMKKSKKLKTAILNVVGWGAVGVVSLAIVYFAGSPESFLLRGNTVNVDAANKAVEIAYVLLFVVGTLCLLSILSLPILLALRLRTNKLIRNAESKRSIPRRGHISSLIQTGYYILISSPTMTRSRTDTHDTKQFKRVGYVSKETASFRDFPLPDLPTQPSAKKLDYYAKKSDNVNWRILKQDRKIRKVKKGLSLILQKWHERITG